MGSPSDKAFREQLRGALVGISSEASAGRRGPEAEQHCALLQQLAQVLRQASANPTAGIRQEDYPLLQCDAGRFLLTVCGFEEAPQAGPPSKGRPLAWLLPEARAARLALSEVVEHLASLQRATAAEAEEKQAATLPPPVAKANAETSAAPRTGTAASLGATLRGFWNDRQRSRSHGTPAEDPAKGSPRDHGKGGSCSSSVGATEAQAGGASAAPSAGAGSCGEQCSVERQAVATLVQRWILAAVAKAFPTPPDLSDEEVAIATALEESMQTFEFKRQRPGVELSLPLMGELGVSFERQPDGSDTCAIHCLNNIAQARLPPEEAAAYAAAAVAAQAAAASGEALDLRGIQRTGPFALHDLQAAEVESRANEGPGSFLAPAVASMLRQPVMRMDSISSGDGTRTGMFDVEAVKVAARSKGFEVIDIEPTPTWEETEAARYVESARDMEARGCRERWFLGFVVYERLPGRAMHYYSLLRWPSAEDAKAAAPASDGTSEEVWLVLDSLDRGAQSPRNRLLSLKDVIEHYHANGEWFKSWLVRWYPVVDRRAAVAALQQSLAGHVARALGDGAARGEAELGLSAQRAEVALDGDWVRWDVPRAQEELLESAALVERELQVLRLAVSEQQARRQLEACGWAFEAAVRSQAEQMLRRCAAAPVAVAAPAAASQAQEGSEDVAWIHGTRATYLALQAADWNARSAAQVLLLTARASAGALAQDELSRRLGGVAAALEAAEWDADRALAVMQFLREEAEGTQQGDGETEGAAKAPPAEALTEAEAFRLLELSAFDLGRGRKLLEVRRRFPRTPVAVCAEAFRREHGHPLAACALLEEFEGRMRALVAHTISARSAQEPGLNQDPKEVEQVAQLALDAAEWNPAVAFSAAENFAASVVEVRRELLAFEMHARARALEVVERTPGATDAVGGAAVEKEVAAALVALDSIDEFRKQPPTPQDILEALKEVQMQPMAAAAHLWQRRTRLAPRRPAAASQTLPPQPPAPPGSGQGHWLPPQTAVPPPIGGTGYPAAGGARPGGKGPGSGGKGAAGAAGSSGKGVAGSGGKGGRGAAGAPEGKKPSSGSKKKGTSGGGNSSSSDCSLM